MDLAVVKRDGELATGSEVGLVPAGPMDVCLIISSGPDPYTRPTVINVGGVERPEEGVPIFAVKRIATTTTITECLFFFSGTLCVEPRDIPTEVPLAEAITAIPGTFATEGTTTSPIEDAIAPGAEPDRTPTPVPWDTIPGAVKVEADRARGTPALVPPPVD